MKELCILYHYHSIDDLTLQHLNLIKENNPDDIVIPVTNDVDEYLPDTVDVNKFPSPWDTSSKWRSIDTTFYLWFLNREVSAKRYLILEYDCRCTMPLRDAYAEVWDADVSCRTFYTPENKPNWGWFKKEEVNKLDPEDRPYIAGVVPYVATLFSHDGATRTIENLTYNDVFCELRMGTAIRKAGLQVQTFPESLKKTIYATTTKLDLSKPGIYHPVKEREKFEKKLQKKYENQRKAAQNNRKLTRKVKDAIKNTIHRFSSRFR